MSDEKAATARRTAAKPVAVARTRKSRKPATAAMTKSTGRKKTVSPASAHSLPVPAPPVGKAPLARKTAGSKRATKPAAATAKPIELKKAASAVKAPGPASARPDGLGKAAGAYARGKAVGVTGPARRTATLKPEGELDLTASAARKPIEEPTEPSMAERRRWIAVAAYHRAEQRGFAPGFEVQDWLDAEAEVDELIGQAGSD